MTPLRTLRLMSSFVWCLSALLMLLLMVKPVLSNNYLVLGNAKIYTVDEAQPWAEAIAIDGDGVLVAVGSESDVMAFVNDAENQYINLDQRLVLPGFQDVHLHAVEAGINSDLCDMHAYTDIRDVPFFLELCPDGGFFADQGWIVGAGIDVGYLLGQLDEDADLEYPITILDREYPETPVLILDNLGHGAIANTIAHELVGYDVLDGSPPGGKIVRDVDTDDLTGIVLENAQQRLRDAAFPPTSQANQQHAYDSLLNALDTLAANGITSISDAGGFWRQAQTEAWARAESEGVLTVRASNALYIYPDMSMEEQLPELIQRYSNDPDALVRFNQAKIYVDGILSLATAALYDPYESVLGLPSQDELGFEYFGSRDTLLNVSTTLSNAGFQLHFHVTGDRGAGLALDAIESATAATNSSSSGPHVLTHNFLVSEQDRPRFAELNAVADFQMTPSSFNSEYIDFLQSDIIGSARTATLLPALEVYEAGALVTISSDWDADELSPLVKIRTVLTRLDGRSIPNLETAIQLMTLNPAIRLQHADRTGSIQVGKYADLAILDQDIFELAPENIDEASVVATIFQGEAVYDPEGILGDPIGIMPPILMDDDATSGGAPPKGGIVMVLCRMCLLSSAVAAILLF